MRKTFSLRLRRVNVLLVLSVLYSATATAQELRRIHYGTSTSTAHLPIWVAKDAGLFVGAAAVADYRPAKAASAKIKKNAATLSLAMERTRDILADVRKQRPKLFMVGFAAETENLARNARGKLAGKKLDMVAANLVGNGRAFDRDDNELHVYWNKGGKSLGKDSKANLARSLAELIAKRYR